MGNQGSPIIINNNRAWCFGWCLSTIVIFGVLASISDITSEEWIIIGVIVAVGVWIYAIWKNQSKNSEEKEAESNEVKYERQEKHHHLSSPNHQEEKWIHLKICPYCWEEIQKTAKKCKFCGERLTEKEK